ncbi:MAG: heavy metal-binding domain-containing protein [Nitrososphaerota archaeon]|nr:heavy metal-binding domain-containing protein [Nitrososphaerota archaeon]
MSDTAVYCPNCRTQLKTNSSNSVQPGGYGLPMLFTSNYVPGYKIDKVLGMVYGITVRSRGIGCNIIAGLRTIAGGEIREYTEMAHQARQQALDRLMEHAQSLGANAVISVMFDSTEIGGTMDEIIAFGTAVNISPAGESQQLVKLS